MEMETVRGSRGRSRGLAKGFDVTAGFFGRFWRGELSVVGAWAAGLAVSLAFGLVLGALLAGLEPGSTVFKISLWAVFGVVVALSVWENVGLWRSSGRAAEDRKSWFVVWVGRALSIFGWVTLAVCTVWFAVLMI